MAFADAVALFVACALLLGVAISPILLIAYEVSKPRPQSRGGMAEE